jgi:plasmid stabilization system protein ParE
MLNTVWTNTAKRDLKQIYNYIKNVKKSPQGALNVVNDIIEASETIIYFEQYQKDEINNAFRRIII